MVLRKQGRSPPGRLALDRFSDSRALPFALRTLFR